MEDFSDFQYPFTTSETSLLISVFDGHAGHRCASFLAHSLPAEVKKETLHSAALLPNDEIFRKIFKSLDQVWLESASKKEPRIEDGSTALCVALDCSDMIVANCGDCRAILSQNGSISCLTRDHKPSDEIEQQRIVNQGGTVIGGRLQGQLAVSRAFGNYELKEAQILSSEPEIHHVSLTPDVEYLVVGSDGLYEHFTNEEIISFLKNGLLSQSSPNLESVVKDLVEEAIDRGSGDNITILVVKFEKAFKKLLKKKG
jgi:serine/threonine protein phosphatase PrpC